MTTGDYLVSHSTLPSGTALQHLLALQVGTGSGETIFASRFSVTIEQDEITVQQRAKRQAAPAQEIRKPSAEQSPTANRQMFARYRQDQIIVTSQPHPELYVTTTQRSALATQSFARTTINPKRK